MYSLTYPFQKDNQPNLISFYFILLGSSNTYSLDVDYALESGDYFFSADDQVLCESGRKVMVTIEED